MMTFTHRPIATTPFLKTLPEGTALVLEGGGTRGFYSAGVMDAFASAGMLFPYIAAVSAGAANALSYISGQIGRNRQVVEHYVADPRYLSPRNLLCHRSLFGTEFVFHEIPEQHIFFDWNAFWANSTRFLTGAVNCVSGESVWFEKEDISPTLEPTIASCALPLLSPMQTFHGYDLLDGGVSDPIPIEKSIADGNSFHVVVLTRNEGYQKTPFKQHRLASTLYRKYPNLVDTLLTRHETYNRQLKLCEQLEREGKAVIIRPRKPLQLDRFGADTVALLALYDEGVAEGADKLEDIIQKQKQAS